MSEELPPEQTTSVVSLHPGATRGDPVTFDRGELRDILNLYGRKVAEGEWRDYAIDFTREKAVFSIFRRAANTRSTASRRRRSWLASRGPTAS